MARRRRGSEAPAARMPVPAAVLLLAASVLVHWPFGVSEFALDDYDFIQVNASIRSLSGAWDALLAPFPPDQPERALYRPLTNLSYALDYALFGEEARGYHLTNVALYLGLVLLVYGLALRYLASPDFAFAAALVFSLHPVHTGAVDAVAGRSELLALGFGLASILLFLRAVGSSGSGIAALGGSLLAYALSCLSKESGAVLPGVLAFHALLFHPPRSERDRTRRSRALRFLVPFALVLAGYAALRLSVLGRFSPEVTPLAGEPLGVRLWTMGSVFLEYLRLLVYPDVLQTDYYYQYTIGIVSEPSARAVLGLLALALWLALLAAMLVRHLRAAPADDEAPTSTRAVAIVSMAIFTVFLLPVSHVLDIGAVLAERFLLAPSLGFVLLAVLAARHLLHRGLADPQQRRGVAALLLATLAVLGGWRSALRAAEWRDSALLWKSAARAMPGDSRVHSNLGGVYMQRGEYALARRALERALEVDPRNTNAIGNLGAVELQIGNYEGAATILRRLLAQQPGNYTNWNNLGIAEAELQRHAAAVRHYQRALQLNPNYAPARINLRVSRQAIAEAQRLLAEQREALASIEDPVLLERLAAACTAIGDSACAAELADRAASAASR